MIPITHLRRVAITAPDPGSLARFYEDAWGLGRVTGSGDSAYLRGTGAEHHILAIHRAARSSVRSISFGVKDRDAVDAAFAELRQRRGVRASSPAPSDEPGGGYGFRVSDREGREVELLSDVERSAHDVLGTTGVHPRKLSHVVLNSAHAGALEELLGDVLGFRLSDRTAAMSFFRCNADHHAIAVTKAPHASLNHVAFELPQIDDVLRGISDLQARGVSTIWGPGRHGPGDNVFAYFRAPNGQVIEYTTELQQITDEDDYVARFWQAADYRIRDAWADPRSLQPSDEARRAMLGEPEGGPADASDDGGTVGA